MSLRLIIEDDEGSTTIVPLGKDAVTIGRQQGNTIQLTEKNVSRRHARLLPDGETWVLEDLGSYNGVKVNGRSVEGRASLREGDVVQIGDYHLALTEDVERRSLNYDRPRAAANEPVEPMLASSSTNLPRLSPDELAALSSGQHVAAAPAPPPLLLDSGQVPMARVQPASYPEERQKKGAGLLVGLGLVGIGVIALGGFWLATNRGGSTTAVAANDSPRADAKTPASVVEPAPTAAKPETQVVEPTPPGPTPAVNPVPTEPTPPPVADDAGEVEVEPEPPPVEKAPPVAKKAPTDKPTPKKPPPSSTPKAPTPPPTPAVDVSQLMADARKASMTGNPSAGYDLALKAYSASKSQDALALMATAACKMGDAGKAKKAIGKLKGSRREDSIKLCASKGIVIE